MTEYFFKKKTEICIYELWKKNYCLTNSACLLSGFSLIFKLLWKSQVIFFPKHYSFYTLLSSCTILPESLTLSLRLRVRFNICSVSFSCIPLWCLMIVSASSPSPTLRCRNCDSKISNNHMHQSSSFYIDFFFNIHVLSFA